MSLKEQLQEMKRKAMEYDQQIEYAKVNGFVEGMINAALTFYTNGFISGDFRKFGTIKADLKHILTHKPFNLELEQVEEQLNKYEVE